MNTLLMPDAPPAFGSFDDSAISPELLALAVESGRNEARINHALEAERFVVVEQCSIDGFGVHRRFVSAHDSFAAAHAVATVHICTPGWSVLVVNPE